MDPAGRKRFLITLQLYSEAFHEGVLSYCLEHGHESRLLTVENLAEVARERYDGLIGGLPENPDHPILRHIVGTGLPVVEYSYGNPEIKNVCRIPLDNALSGRMAADCLLRRPVASFAFVSDRRGDTEIQRAHHFEQFLRRPLNGRPYAAYFHRERNEDDEAKSDIRLAAFLKSLTRPAGVFASTDVFAARVCEVARRNGLAVPEDLAVIANGNRGLVTRLVPVPITAIELDPREWGRRAAALLDEFVSGKVPPGTVRLYAPKGIVERESTGGTAGGDPLVSGAIALMKQNLSDPLNVPELARRLGVSPATLKRAFASRMGVAVSDCCLRLRIESAKGLLLAGHKVDAVARDSGFASTGSFRKAFIRIVGVTPGSFETGGS